MALLCLVIYLLKSYSDYLLPHGEDAVDTGGKIYVEIDDGTFSTVRALSNPGKLAEIKDLYNISNNLPVT